MAFLFNIDLCSVFNSGGDVEYMGGPVEESIFKLGICHVFLDDGLRVEARWTWSTRRALR